MSRSLFLHYGPGGNSDVEAGLLGSTLPDMIFWNQPTVKESLKPYKELVKRCANEIQSVKATQIVGHSFGCDLLASLLKHERSSLSEVDSGKSILISPLRSIPLAMINLGRALNSKRRFEDLDSALDLAATYGASPPPEVFWNLIMQISPHPDYLSSFWVDPAAKAKSDQIAVNAAAFDPAEWQVVMNDYLFAGQEKDMDVFKSEKALAVFGDSDPYYTADDFKYWREILGPKKVIIIKDCGHFPHLEKQEEFVKAIKV